MSPLKIALIGSRGIPAAYSGFETFYEQLAVRLVQRGHSVTVYNRSHFSTKRQQYKGVNIVTLPSIRTKHLETLSHTFLSLCHGLAQNYDIVYVCIVGNSPLCIIPRLTSVPVIINVDGADFAREKWTGLAKLYLRMSERIACAMGATIIADCRVIQRRYKELYNRDTVFIPYGANIIPRDKVPTGDVLARFGLEPDRYILFVSRTTPENAAHVLVKAFRQLPTDMKLVIVGDAPYVDGYHNELAKLCSEDPRVVVTGYLFGDDYRAISANSRLFVLPSAIDGTRPVLLDQMGFGNCIVIRDTPANLEVAQDCALTFSDVDDVEDLTRVLAKLLDDDATVAEYRNRAIAHVRKNYSWEMVTDKYEELFYSLAISDRKMLKSAEKR